MATIQTLEEADRRIRQIEEKYDLLRFRLDGWSVWFYLRSYVWEEILHYPSLGDRSWVWERLRMAIKSLPALLFPRKTRTLIKTASSLRAETENGKYKDFIFDDLIPYLQPAVKMEWLNNRSFLFDDEQVLIKSDLSNDALLLIAFFLSKFPAPAKIQRLAKEIASVLKDEPGLGKFTPAYFTQALHFYYRCKQAYAWYLRRIDPQMVLVADPDDDGLFTAAKEQGCRLIEFQHGIVYPNHINYSWTAYARPYKPSMPVPNKIILFSEYSADILRQNGFWDAEPIPAGSLRIDHYRARRRQVKRQPSGRCNVLITSDGNPLLMPFMQQTLEAVDPQVKLELIFKLHPASENDKTPYLNAFGNDPRVQVILGNEPPSTFDLMSRADIHISISSSCHIEALGLGIPTVVLPLETYEAVDFLYNAGYARLVQDPAALAALLDHWKDLTVPPQVSELFFKVNALQNTLDALK